MININTNSNSLKDEFLKNNPFYEKEKKKGNIPHHLLIDAAPINAKTADFQQTKFIKQIEKLNEIARESRSLNKNRNITEDKELFTRIVNDNLEQNTKLELPTNDSLDISPDDYVSDVTKKNDFFLNFVLKNNITDKTNENEIIEVGSNIGHFEQKAIDTYIKTSE